MMYSTWTPSPHPTPSPSTLRTPSFRRTSTESHTARSENNVFEESVSVIASDPPHKDAMSDSQRYP